MRLHIIRLVMASGLSMGTFACQEQTPIGDDKNTVEATSGSGDASSPVAPTTADASGTAPLVDAPSAPSESTSPATSAPDAGSALASDAASVSAQPAASASDDGGAVAAPTDASVGTSRPPSAVEQQVLDLIELGMKMSVPSSMIMPLYKQLEPVTVEFMTSQWHGSLFSGTPQGQAGWWGKNMKDPKDVQPMIFQRDDGSVYPNENYGRAALSMASWSGLSPSVLLKYKTLGIKDYFRRVTDDTVLGLTPASAGSNDFFFRLSRDNDTVIGK